MNRQQAHDGAGQLFARRKLAIQSKVTTKKKFINDILMMSKGASNLPQNVVMVVSNTVVLNINSPLKG